MHTESDSQHNLLANPGLDDRGRRAVAVAKELMQLGVNGSQITRLMNTHELEKIEQQLAWLPHRKARRKSSLIIAAIDRDYERPVKLSMRHDERF